MRWVQSIQKTFPLSCQLMLRLEKILITSWLRLKVNYERHLDVKSKSSSPVIRESVDWILPLYDILPQCRVGGASAHSLTLLALIFAYSIFSTGFITLYWPVPALGLITSQLWRTTASCSFMQKTKKKWRGKLSAELSWAPLFCEKETLSLNNKTKTTLSLLVEWELSGHSQLVL